MGRTVLADHIIQQYVDTLALQNKWILGLIIGKLTNQKDYAVHFVRTPEPLEDQASDDNEAAAGTKIKSRRSQNKPAGLDAMNELWAATHAKQVTMMLPGGLGVIGIFAIAPPDMMQTSQGKLKQILFAIRKIEIRSIMPGLADDISDRILLQICSDSKKFMCRSINVNDPKSTFGLADWKFQSNPESWLRLETQLAINVPVNIPLTSHKLTLAKQIQSGLQPFCNKLCSSLTLIDGNVRKKTDLLDQSADRRGKSRDKGQTPGHVYRCNIIVQHCIPSAIQEPVIQEYSIRLILKGIIHGRAYVTSKATVEDAQNALRTDLVRGILSRSELLSDDIQVVEEDAEQPEVYTSPRRVFFQLPGTSLELCDYMFQDEKLNEVKGRVRELLDITLQEEDFDLSCERAATEEDCSQLGFYDAFKQNQEEKGIVSKGVGLYIAAAVGGAIALTTAVLSYVFSQYT